MDDTGQAPIQDTDDNSLDKPSTVVEAGNNAGVAGEPVPAPDAATPATPVPEPGGNNPINEASSDAAATSPPPEEPHHHLSLGHIFRHFNIYLLLFILIVIIAAVILVISITKSQKPPTTPKINAQNLTQSQLEQIAGSSSTSIGQPNQVLNIGANAIISGQVLIRQDLDVAGSIKVGGSLNLPALQVSGTGTFGQIQANKLAISGDTAVQGALTVGGNLSVAGSGNFGGTLSANKLVVQTLQLNGDLVLDNHIQAGGSSPTRTTGSAVGAGGTTSISGSDTSGSVSINTGSGAGAGCFITVYFAQKFNATPHIVVTPVGSGAAGLAYYINRSTSNFSICTTTPPPSGQSFGFDYVAFD